MSGVIYREIPRFIRMRRSTVRVARIHGKQEFTFYRTFKDHLPIHVPKIPGQAVIDVLSDIALNAVVIRVATIRSKV